MVSFFSFNSLNQSILFLAGSNLPGMMLLGEYTYTLNSNKNTTHNTAK